MKAQKEELVSHTFVLGLVVVGERLRPTLYAQDAPGVARIGLPCSVLVCIHTNDLTYYIDFVLRDDADRRRASRDFLFVFGV